MFIDVIFSTACTLDRVSSLLEKLNFTVKNRTLQEKCFLLLGLKYRSRVQVIAPLIHYQTTQIPPDLIEHFVKRLGLGDSFNAVRLSLSW